MWTLLQPTTLSYDFLIEVLELCSFLLDDKGVVEFCALPRESFSYAFVLYEYCYTLQYLVVIIFIVL